MPSPNDIRKLMDQVEKEPRGIRSVASKEKRPGNAGEVPSAGEASHCGNGLPGKGAPVRANKDRQRSAGTLIEWNCSAIPDRQKLAEIASRGSYTVAWRKSAPRRCILTCEEIGRSGGI